MKGPSLPAAHSPSGPLLGDIGCFQGASSPGLCFTGAGASILGSSLTPRSPPGLLGAPPAMPLLNGPALSTALLQLALQTQSQKVTARPKALGPPYPYARPGPMLVHVTPRSHVPVACRRWGEGRCSGLRR